MQWPSGCADVLALAGVTTTGGGASTTCAGAIGAGGGATGAGAVAGVATGSVEGAAAGGGATGAGLATTIGRSTYTICGCGCAHAPPRTPTHATSLLSRFMITTRDGTCRDAVTAMKFRTNQQARDRAQLVHAVPRSTLCAGRTRGGAEVTDGAVGLAAGSRWNVVGGSTGRTS